MSTGDERPEPENRRTADLEYRNDHFTHVQGWVVFNNMRYI